MEQVALTGTNGFLGRHTRAALREEGFETHAIGVGDSFNLETASSKITGASRLIHMAGVNRGSDVEVSEDNVQFAQQMAEALVRADEPPNIIVFANSAQATNGSVYGDAKAVAAETLRAAAETIGAEFHNVILPNLFGEHGRPLYNAVTATFCQLLSQGDELMVHEDKELTLLHAQDAADALIGRAKLENIDALQIRETVSGLARRLAEMAVVYNREEIPDVAAKFDRDLFNTYRSFTFPSQAPVRLTRHADARGSFFEIIRSHEGSGQSSFSTTEPGVSRGDHFHRRKIERFTVLSGSATIALRKLFTDDIFEFEVTGDKPVAVDMPTMWSHKITNTGSDVLYTSFWSNDIFDPLAPDTIAEAVHA